MEDVGIALKIVLLTSLLGIITCAFIYVVILLVRWFTSSRKGGVEET
jgi:hypothetical protein